MANLFVSEGAMREKLRKPFEKEQIGRLPRTAKRPALDFVGHAIVTDRLNNADPGWTYTIDDTRRDGDTTWIIGTMTIGGVSRAEVGDGKDLKEAIGNFIRRGAMRFGVGIDLWAREELETSAPSVSGTVEGDRSFGGSARSSPSTSTSGADEAFGEGVTTAPEPLSVEAGEAHTGASESAAGHARNASPKVKDPASTPASTDPTREQLQDAVFAKYERPSTVLRAHQQRGGTKGRVVDLTNEDLRELLQ